MISSVSCLENQIISFVEEVAGGRNREGLVASPKPSLGQRGG